MSAVVTARPVLPHLWTADEFLDWMEPSARADLLDGEIYMHSPASLRHANLINVVHCLMFAYVQHRRLGVVHRETWAVKLGPRRVVLPDIAYFNPEQTAQLQDTFSPVAPALVVEALSPGRAERDRIWKFSAYEERGVLEYWLLDPDRLEHQFFAREGDYLVEVRPQDGVVHSTALPGFRIELAWLDPAQPPDLLACLQRLLTP